MGVLFGFSQPLHLLWERSLTSHRSVPVTRTTSPPSFCKNRGKSVLHNNHAQINSDPYYTRIITSALSDHFCRSSIMSCSAKHIFFFTFWPPKYVLANHNNKYFDHYFLILILRGEHMFILHGRGNVTSYVLIYVYIARRRNVMFWVLMVFPSRDLLNFWPEQLCPQVLQMVDSYSSTKRQCQYRNKTVNYVQNIVVLDEKNMK